MTAARRCPRCGEEWSEVGPDGYFCRPCNIFLPRAATLKAPRTEADLDDQSEKKQIGHLNPSPPRLVRVADVQPRPTRWLWKPYIPLGKVTLLEGDPGLGKSWILTAMAAAVSVGSGLPGMPTAQPRDVTLASAEDGLADTLRPRLDALGADLKRIHAIDGLLTLDAGGVATLESYIQETQALFVGLDPLVAYLDGELDIHRANETRAVMAALAALAERQGCAIVAVRHLSKATKERAIYRGIGSIDFTAAARSVLLVGCDPDNQRVRALAQIKSNLAALGDPIGYSVEHGQFYWTGATELTVRRMLAAEGTQARAGEAEALLLEMLADGPRAQEDIEQAASQHSIALSTLRRAKARLRVHSERRGETGKRGAGRWFWRLPDLDAQDDQQANLSTLIDSESEASVAKGLDDHLNRGSDAAIAELLRRYHRVEGAHGPPRLVWAGRVLWRREQFIDLLAGLNGDAPAALRELSAQLAHYEAAAAPARGSGQ